MNQMVQIRQLLADQFGIDPDHMPESLPYLLDLADDMKMAAIESAKNWQKIRSEIQREIDKK